MKKIFCGILAIFLCISCASALDLDTSVDDVIRKNYKSDQLIEEGLPELPQILREQSEHTKLQPDTPEIIHKKTTPAIYRGKIKKGTKFYVVNDNTISDSLRRGTKITFHTKTPIYSKGIIIPAGTKFFAAIEESHAPQITCNGGLVVLKVYTIVLNNSVTPIDGYITRADSKKIFLNNIKGRRTYLKTLWKKTGWGRNLFNRMLTLSINLGGDGSTLILSPFPVCYGTIVLGLNTLSSPLFALFSKGGRVNIPVGTEFVIKLRNDVNFYY